MITYPYKLGDIMAHQYHLYCKYFLLQNKPQHVNVNNAWGGPITYPKKDEDALYLKYDNNYLAKRWYVDQFCDFQQTSDITAL